MDEEIGACVDGPLEMDTKDCADVTVNEDSPVHGVGDLDGGVSDTTTDTGLSRGGEDGMGGAGGGTECSDTAAYRWVGVLTRFDAEVDVSVDVLLVRPCLNDPSDVNTDVNTDDVGLDAKHLLDLVDTSDDDGIVLEDSVDDIDDDTPQDKEDDNKDDGSR